MSDLFEALDLGMDGKVQIDEVIQLLAQSGLFLQNRSQTVQDPDEQNYENVSIEDVRTVLCGVDFDHDQIIEFNEFLMICGDRNRILSNYNIQRLFEALD